MTGAPRRTGRLVLISFLVPVALIWVGGGRSPAGERPNIVLVVTDDQRWDTLWAMPELQNDLIQQGVTFTNGFAENPLCCPSRASILTGQYSHTTGIYENAPPNGGFADFDDHSTVATWLEDAGYRTALIGKYLNGYSQTEGEYVAPGWSRWVVHSGGNQYFNYRLSVDGEDVTYGNGEADYSTDVFASYAADFIETTPAGTPLFLMFTPHAPHEQNGGAPPAPAPRHEGAFAGLPPWRPPSYNETDVTDKPAWVQVQPLWDLARQAEEDAFRIGQYESLLAVDDAVGAIIDALSEASRIGNTLIVFASDNGYLWGEHRLDEKNVPYEEAIRLPFVVRFDPLTSDAREDAHLVMNTDLAPTFADAAGVRVRDVEGVSFLPLLSGGAPWRKDFLVEHSGTGAPPFCLVRSSRYVYVLYAHGPEELYDLRVDPYQLENRVEVPAYARVLRGLRAREAELCVPAPPGFGD